MQTRTFTLPERRACRVTLIQPSQVLAERRGGDDRRECALSAALAGAGGAAGNPPRLERRRAADRRRCATPQRNGLPGSWQGGWLLFETLPAEGEGADAPAATDAYAARRLAPVPSGWATCSDAELVEWWRRATVARSAGGGRTAGSGVGSEADSLMHGASRSASGEAADALKV